MPYAAVPGLALLFGHRLPLAEYDPAAPAASPLVSIIIPARNEADRIERCVRSVLGTRYPNVEVLVVDDRSTDATATIVTAIRDPRLTLVEGADLPDDTWFGKPWACWQGAQRARGEILLFTDADTWHGPDLLGRAVAMLRTRQADLVTLLQRQEMGSFWERVTQPHLFALIGAPVVLTRGSVEAINERQGPRDAIANGQFIMVTRTSYDAIGGHAAVKGDVVEDIMLARRYAEAGRRRWFANAMDDMSTRMYRSLPELVEGWSKNLFMGTQIVWGPRGGYVLMALIFAIVLAGFLPAPALVAGLAGAPPAVLAFGAFGFAMNALATALFLRTNREPEWPGLFFWCGQLALLYILVRSTLRGKRRIEWKGRVYRHA